MTRALPIMPVIGSLSALAGLVLLIRPAILRDALSLSDEEGAAYALRIIGAMLFALGLFLVGFWAALAQGPAA